MKKKLAAAAVAALMTVGLITVPATSANAANTALQNEIAAIKKDNGKFTYWIGICSTRHWCDSRHVRRPRLFKTSVK